MIYQTLTLRLYRPGAQKRRILDGALTRYAAALQRLLDLCRADVEKLRRSGRPARKAELLRLLTPARLRAINARDAEPFKDSLKMEFAALCTVYLAQARAGGRASYPCVYADPAACDRLLERLRSAAAPDDSALAEWEHRYRLCQSRLERPHPLYFGRCDSGRDFCLLYDPEEGRYFSKLYLLNARQALPPKPDSGGSGRSLQYLTREGGTLEVSSGRKRRFLLFPLAFGTHQLRALEQARQDPALIHTARLVRHGGQYDLLVTLEVPVEPAARPVCTMGVARSPLGGLHYTFCRPDGSAFARGTVAASPLPAQRPYLLAQEVVRLARRHTAQVVLESAGGRQDHLPLFTAPDQPAAEQANLPPLSSQPAPVEGPPASSRISSETGAAALPAAAGGPRLTAGDYRSFSRVLSYKLPQAGLPAPISVSAKGLYTACPACRCSTRRNRISPTLFACIRCGFAAPAVEIGSLNLARRPGAYRVDRVPIRARLTPNGTLYYNKLLRFELLLPPGKPDLNRVYYQLSLLAHASAGFEANTRRYAMLQKLRAADDIRAVVRILPPVRPRRPDAGPSSKRMH